LSVNEIEKCIKDCEKSAQDLRRIADQSTDNLVKRTLLDSVRHIDLCIQECKAGVEQVRVERAF